MVDWLWSTTPQMLQRQQHGCGGMFFARELPLGMCFPSTALQGGGNMETTPMVFMVLWQLWPLLEPGVCWFTLMLTFAVSHCDSSLHLVSAPSLYSCELWQHDVLKSARGISVTTFIRFSYMPKKTTRLSQNCNQLSVHAHSILYSSGSFLVANNILFCVCVSSLPCQSICVKVGLREQEPVFL